MPATLSTNLDPTERLLLLAARTELSKEMAEEVRKLIDDGIDPDLLLARADRHRVAPLLFNSLSTLGDELLPAGVLESLSASYFESLARNMAFFDALREVLTALETAGIPVIVLKGAAIAEAVYDDIALRPMADLDVLVHSADLATVDRVLANIGFSVAPGLLAPAYYRKNHFHLAYYSSDRDVPLEIHWGLQEDLGLSGPDLAQIWKGVVRGPVAGLEALVMEPEDLLLYLCLHLEKHGYYNRYLAGRDDAAKIILSQNGANALCRFCDLREVISRDAALDWEAFLDKARRWGLSDVVASSLNLLEQLFGSSPASSGPAVLEQPRLRWFEAPLLHWAVEMEQSDPGRSPSRRWYRRTILDMSGPLQFRPVRLISLLGHLFPRRKEAARHYRISGALVAVYYVGHVLRTASRAGAGFLQLVYYSTRKALERS